MSCVALCVCGVCKAWSVCDACSAWGACIVCVLCIVYVMYLTRVIYVTCCVFSGMRALYTVCVLCVTLAKFLAGVMHTFVYACKRACLHTHNLYVCVRPRLAQLQVAGEGWASRFWFSLAQ